MCKTKENALRMRIYLSRIVYTLLSLRCTERMRANKTPALLYQFFFLFFFFYIFMIHKYNIFSPSCRCVQLINSFWVGIYVRLSAFTYISSNLLLFCLAVTSKENISSDFKVLLHYYYTRIYTYLRKMKRTNVFTCVLFFFWLTISCD